MLHYIYMNEFHCKNQPGSCNKILSAVKLPTTRGDPPSNAFDLSRWLRYCSLTQLAEAQCPSMSHFVFKYANHTSTPTYSNKERHGEGISGFSHDAQAADLVQLHLIYCHVLQHLWWHSPQWGSTATTDAAAATDNIRSQLAGGCPA